ncbi:MAG TPA: hypothetical protein VMP08_23170 [Anaerolineae bacterium]|nr:hypothetical protein [Anaerolineae bacterium]
MKKISLMLLTTVVVLMLVSPVAANGPTGAIGIYSVAACQDTTTVAISGTASASTNRIKAWLYKQNNNGDWNLLADTVTDNFNSGNFLMSLVLNYFGKAVDDGTPLQVVVKLQSRNGNTWVDIGATSTIVNASDKTCQNKCSVTISTADRAPADGVITVRSHYGSFFRPEGWLHSAMSVKAGQIVHYAVVAVPCNWTVRAWYYPATGKDRTPKLLPAQYWPDEFAATSQDGANPYTTSFAKGIKATAPLEADDPYAPK